MRQSGFFGLSDHMKRLSADGDPLEVLGGVVDFVSFRPTLMAALAYSNGSRGGRPPYDPVVMLKVLVLAAQNNVSDARMEWLIRDRLSWLRFLGCDLGAATPDANTIRGGSGNLDSVISGGRVPDRASLLRNRSDDEQTTPPEPHAGFQGEGGFGRHQGRQDAGRVGAAF